MVNLVLADSRVAGYPKAMVGKIQSKTQTMPRKSSIQSLFQVLRSSVCAFLAEILWFRRLSQTEKKNVIVVSKHVNGL